LHHGQEIYLFFFKYKENGIVGGLISALIIGLIIFLSFRIIREFKITEYYQFLETINKKKSKINFNKLISCFINLFVLISFYIMIAGFASYISQQFNLPVFIGSIIIAFFAFITLNKNIEGIIKVNTILIPILIMFIFIIGIIYGNNELQINRFNTYENINWLLSAILYSSYNSILLIPILINLKKFITENNQIVIISIIIFFIIILLIISIYRILNKINVDISTIELPVIYAINFLGNRYKIIYGFIIISSIFTSAISSGYAFLSNFSKSKEMYKYLNLFICISSIFISNVGFSKLINFLYPTFGIFGLVQIFLIIKSNYKLTIEKYK